MPSMEEPIAVITGSTGGIGAAVTLELAQRGWRLILVNRSQDKAQQQKDTLNTTYGHSAVEIVSADLMDVKEIAKACAHIAAKAPRIDALYNIAGILTSEYRRSAQGHEAHYALNVLANYAMIQGLLANLRREKSEPPTMVVTMSSSAIEGVKSLDVSDLSQPAQIGGLMGAYANSKLALTAMGAAIAPQLHDEGILVRSVDPGATLTAMTSSGDGMPFILRWLAPIFFSKPEKQALKIIDAADPEQFEGRTGIYVASGKEKRLPKALRDEASYKAEILALLSSDFKEGLIGDTR